jgi:hypothetical protein
MRNGLKGFFVAVLVMFPVVRAEAQQPSTPPGERLVKMAPCRLVDTRLNAPASTAEETARRIDVASTRCGRFVPSIATAYSMRITSYDRANDGSIPPQKSAVTPPLSRHPVGPPITFPVPPGSHITVDLEGFYVPPNTPVDPTLESQSGNVTAASAQPVLTPKASSTGTPVRPKTEKLWDGTAGQMYLDASRVGYVGVFGIASVQSHWVQFMSGNADGMSGFGVYNGNYSELMRVSADGPTRLISGWSYLSGRTDYRETTSIPNNTVHEVTITNPRDALGGATTRVVFFDATSTDEVGSPSTTKYRAFTNGINNHADINFDSQIAYSFSNSPEYYYRAYSQKEGIETFWLKAATNLDAYTNTRADMYVSGIVGIGKTPNAAYALDVNGSIHATQVIGADYQDVAEWVPASETMSAGTVVIVSGSTKNTVGPSQRAYDTRVAGVVSAQPGLILGEASSSKAKIATTGRVRVRVDATTQPIAMGDLLVTSDHPGLAMKSEPLDLGGVKIHRPGTLIGKALEPLAGGEGEILVLLSLQ